MTFKQSSDMVSLANRALGLVSESKTISTPDDVGAIPTAIRRWYKPIVAQLLEMHHWGLATKRSSLVAVTNTRANEWLYAYATPDDMAFPVGIALGNGTASISYYRGLAGLIGMIYNKPIFQFHQNIIYSNIEGDLEYVSFDITEADFTASFENIVVLMLGSRLALELPKDYDLSQALAQEATNAINIAITQNLNYGNRKYGMEISEGEMARGSLLGPGWDYIPRAPGS
jgi:hypothetical protein